MFILQCTNQENVKSFCHFTFDEDKALNALHTYQLYGNWHEAYETKICKEVRLIPKTQKGKQRIKQHGDTGKVLDVQNKVQFTSEYGPWLLVNAADPTGRWVHWKHDDNFTLEFILG